MGMSDPGLEQILEDLKRREAMTSRDDRGPYIPSAEDVEGLKRDFKRDLSAQVSEFDWKKETISVRDEYFKLQERYDEVRDLLERLIAYSDVMEWDESDFQDDYAEGEEEEDDPWWDIREWARRGANESSAPKWV